MMFIKGTLGITAIKGARVLIKFLGFDLDVELGIKVN
jgi:hypothetical protein